MYVCKVFSCGRFGSINGKGRIIMPLFGFDLAFGVLQFGLSDKL